MRAKATDSKRFRLLPLKGGLFEISRFARDDKSGGEMTSAEQLLEKDDFRAYAIDFWRA
jgi:hypothetical protein